MKIAIKIKYKDKVYLSNSVEFTKKDLQELEDMLEEVAKGKADYLRIESGDEIKYFPKGIILESIISIIKQND